MHGAIPQVPPYLVMDRCLSQSQLYLALALYLLQRRYAPLQFRNNDIITLIYDRATKLCTTLLRREGEWRYISMHS
jgi:hypothetical protein